MGTRSSKHEFVALLVFLVAGALILSNGFMARILAQGPQVDAYAQTEPIGLVLDLILDEYVRAPDVDKVVEGALIGMMNSLDRHSSYIPPEAYRLMREETKGEFYGIGVKIQYDDEKNIVVFTPLPNSPAARAGVHAGDLIVKIDGVSTTGMTLQEASQRIKGPRGKVVVITVLRRREEGKPDVIDIPIKRDKVALESIKEERVLDGGIGYIRVSDFKDNTTRDLADTLKRFLNRGMTSLILDLRWNSGGLLSASKQVCELFLPKNTLVTYTQGRKSARSNTTEDMKLYTEKEPLLPEGFPMVILTNNDTASSSEIVTGALQFWKRALVVGMTTYGKGSVQTIIPLTKPEESALRLTTALYYTPAEVTIDSNGIKPDLEVAMTLEDQRTLLRQMYDSYKEDPDKVNLQNHGTISGDETAEGTLEDVQLARAVEILEEDPVFEHLIEKYHRDPHETQVAASPDDILKDRAAAQDEVIERLREETQNGRDEPAEQEAPAEEPVPAPVE